MMIEKNYKKNKLEIFKDSCNLSLVKPYKIDCKKCNGLCCIVLNFAKMDGFPENKNANEVCKNLQGDCRCKIYSSLAVQGLKGCMAYDCFGAGQYVTQRYSSLLHGQTRDAKQAESLFNSYLVVMKVHQTLWYCTQCLMLKLPEREKEKILCLIQEGRKLIDQPSEILSILDPQTYCQKANQELKKVSKFVQSQFPKTTTLKTRNYIAKNMRQKNLSGKDLSMSLLIAANLEEAILVGTNLLGADLRDTNLGNTDLRQCLFLSQIQVNAAKGNGKTLLPPFLDRPKTWNCD